VLPPQVEDQLEEFEEPAEDYEEKVIQPDYSEEVLSDTSAGAGAGSVWDRYMGDDRLNEVKKSGWSL
jgi:hypothetical protein